MSRLLIASILVHLRRDGDFVGRRRADACRNLIPSSGATTGATKTMQHGSIAAKVEAPGTFLRLPRRKPRCGLPGAGRSRALAALAVRACGAPRKPLRGEREDLFVLGRKGADPEEPRRLSSTSRRNGAEKS
jgi:hypothetical protein